MRILLTCYIIIISLSKVFSQNSDSSFYRSPIDYPISLSGNFGELRNNHFHSGIDIRTGGEEGKIIYAVADGYVSRIKVSAFGYGNALYITHKNGQVSVYGHLKSYSNKITSFIRAEQYKIESFEIDLFPNKLDLPIIKGDTIALSGNTGGSEAPHLHFEIRDDKTEWTKNPLLNGFSVPDTVKPEIYKIAIYPLNSNSLVENENERKIFDVKVDRGNLSMANQNPIDVSGNIGFAIETNDEENDNAGKNGTYSIQLFIDNILQYQYKINSFAFDQTRNINAHIDYQFKNKFGIKLQKCFVEPNNKFPCYQTNKTRGIFNFSDDSIHLIKIVVEDVHNNSNTLLFIVQSHEYSISKKEKLIKASQDFFYYNIDNNFNRDGIYVHVPKGAIQNDINFEYNIESNTKYYSPIYKVHREDEGLLIPYNLKIKVQKKITKKLQPYLLIASINANGSISAEGGKFNETTNMVESNLKSFGYFTIAIDTIKPTISKVVIDKINAKTRNIIVKVSDNLSGIKSYRGSIDNKWILMEYDYKNGMLIYTFEDNYNDELPHEFKLTVIDQKGNSNSIQKTF